jgi:serine/threonine protein kinase
MRVLSSHPNILALKEALELVQDSKAIIFLVLELARGGELFDRIKVSIAAYFIIYYVSMSSCMCQAVTVLA